MNILYQWGALPVTVDTVHTRVIRGTQVASNAPSKSFICWTMVSLLKGTGNGGTGYW